MRNGLVGSAGPRLQRDPTCLQRECDQHAPPLKLSSDLVLQGISKHIIIFDGSFIAVVGGLTNTQHGKTAILLRDFAIAPSFQHLPESSAYRAECTFAFLIYAFLALLSPFEHVELCFPIRKLTLIVFAICCAFITLRTT